MIRFVCLHSHSFVSVHVFACLFDLLCSFLNCSLFLPVFVCLFLSLFRFIDSFNGCFIYVIMSFFLSF